MAVLALAALPALPVHQAQVVVHHRGAEGTVLQGRVEERLRGQQRVPKEAPEPCEERVLAFGERHVAAEVPVQRHPVAASVQSQAPGQLPGPQAPHAAPTLVECALQGLLADKPLGVLAVGLDEIGPHVCRQKLFQALPRLEGEVCLAEVDQVVPMRVVPEQALHGPEEHLEQAGAAPDGGQPLSSQHHVAQPALQLRQRPVHVALAGIHVDVEDVPLVVQGLEQTLHLTHRPAVHREQEGDACRRRDRADDRPHRLLLGRDAADSRCEDVEGEVAAAGDRRIRGASHGTPVVRQPALLRRRGALAAEALEAVLETGPGVTQAQAEPDAVRQAVGPRARSQPLQQPLLPVVLVAAQRTSRHPLSPRGALAGAGQSGRVQHPGLRQAGHVGQLPPAVQ
uniref:Putative secreted protein n=1 Tax=Ixodes ricinus TaxID=34613 RepID=A0A6B0V9X8_IXORI